MSEPACSFYLNRQEKKVVGLSAMQEHVDGRLACTRLLVRQGKIGGRFRDTVIPKGVVADLRKEVVDRVKGLLEGGYEHLGSADWSAPKDLDHISWGDRNRCTRYYLERQDGSPPDREDTKTMIDRLAGALEGCGVLLATPQEGDEGYGLTACLGTSVTEIVYTEPSPGDEPRTVVREYGCKTGSDDKITNQQGASALLVVMALHHSGRPVEITENGSGVVEPDIGRHDPFTADLWDFEQLVELAEKLGVPRKYTASEMLSMVRPDSQVLPDLYF